MQSHPSDRSRQTGIHGAKGDCDLCGHLVLAAEETLQLARDRERSRGRRPRPPQFDGEPQLSILTRAGDDDHHIRLQLLDHPGDRRLPGCRLPQHPPEIEPVNRLQTRPPLQPLLQVECGRRAEIGDPLDLPGNHREPDLRLVISSAERLRKEQTRGQNHATHQNLQDSHTPVRAASSSSRPPDAEGLGVAETRGVAGRGRVSFMLESNRTGVVAAHVPCHVVQSPHTARPFRPLTKPLYVADKRRVTSLFITHLFCVGQASPVEEKRKQVLILGRRARRPALFFSTEGLAGVGGEYTIENPFRKSFRR